MKDVFLKKNTTQNKGKNYILAIAIDEYKYFENLQNPVSDMDKILETLTAKFQFEDYYIEKLYNDKAKKKAIENAFKDLVNKVEANDNVIVLFSGHGKYNVTSNQTAWITHNTKGGNYARGILTSTINGYIENIKSLHTLLIVDACYGPGQKMKGGYDDYMYNWGSIAVLTAGGRKKVLDGNNMSPFARAFNQCLLNTNVALSFSKIVVEVKSLTFKYAQEEHYIQTPTSGSEGNKRGKFVFYLKKSETDFWKSARYDASEMERYRKLFPKGNYVHIAEQKKPITSRYNNQEVEAMKRAYDEIKNKFDRKKKNLEDQRKIFRSVEKEMKDLERKLYGDKRIGLLLSISILLALSLFIIIIMNVQRKTKTYLSPTISFEENEEGLCLLKRLDKKGNRTYNSALNFQEIDSITGSLIIVKMRDKWGCIDTIDFKEVIAFEYDTIGLFHNGIACVTKNGEQFHLNTVGRIVYCDDD